MNKAQDMGALCEIKLQSGRPCGVQALGRCATCEHAFCASHQAWSGQTSYRNQCAPCAAKAFAEHMSPWDYFASGEARTALLSSGVRPVDMYWFEKRWEPKKGFFGRASRYVDVVIPLGHGWIIGEFRWRYSVPDHDVAKYIEVDWLTALVDKPLDEKVAQSITYGLNLGLYPVQPYSGGYTLLKQNAYLAGSEGESLKAVVQTIRRLAGSSS